MEEELEEASSLRHRSAASRQRHYHHPRRRAMKPPPPPTTNYDDVFGGPPRHAVPFSGVPDDYSEVFGGVSVSCSIPFLDLPTAQMDGWDCASGDSINGVNYWEIFGRCDFSDFAVPYEELFGRGNGDEGDIDDMHFSPASANGGSSVKSRSGPQTIDPSAFIPESSNEDSIPYLDDLDFSVSCSEIPKYNTSYNKANRAPAMELLHTPASVPQPQTGFTFVVEPNKPLPEHLPVVTEDTIMHENSVKPKPRSSANSQSISNREKVPLEVPFPDVTDVNLQVRSANLPPPARPPAPRFALNDRQKTNTFPNMDSVSNFSTETEQLPQPQQEKAKTFFKSDSLPPNFDFVPNLKLDKERPKLKSRPNAFSKSESLPPGFGSELDAMKEAMEFAQARLKTAKELHEGKITELPLKKKHKDENLEGSEREKPRVLQSISLASNVSKSREFMKVQGEVVAAQSSPEWEKSGKWRSDEEFHELTSIVPNKVREDKVGSTGTEPLVEANRESMKVDGLLPTEMGLSGNLKADVNDTENLEPAGEIKYGEESLKREEKTTGGSFEILTAGQEPVIEIEKEAGENDTEASKEDANVIPNVEERENTEEYEAESEDGKGSKLEVGTETEKEDSNRLDEEMKKQRKTEELEQERQREKEMKEEEEEEEERTRKLEEVKERAFQLEEENDRAHILEEEEERKLQMEKEREEKERKERERIAEEEERLEKEREETLRKLAEERERERKLEEERKEEKMREMEMVRKLEEEKERERKLEEIEKERERVRKLEEEREQERERVRKLEEEKQREREMARKLEKEKERERKLEEEIEKERERIRKLEEERELEREKVRKLEEERELERERVRKLEEEREQERERVRKLEEEREKERIEREREQKAGEKMEQEREQKERERIMKEREQKEKVKKLEEEKEKQMMEKEKEDRERQRRMEKEREEKEVAVRFEAERRLERERAEEMERMAKLQGQKAKDRKSDPRKSDEERKRERRMKEKDRKTEGRKSDEEREKARERKSDEERKKERERTRKERKIEEREREEERKREREKDRLAMERATQERAERIESERITAARQRAVENREKEEMNNRGGGDVLEKRRLKGEDEKKEMDGKRNAREARKRAERAAVERATAEARERAIEKAKAEAEKERDRLERYKSFNRISSQDHTQESHFKRTQSDSALCQGHGESALRHKARLERQQRTAERAAKALAEKNRRDIMAQREQAERDRIAEHLDVEVKRWSSGKEGNLRALLSTLQYILGQSSGWQPIHLTEVITAADMKKAYRKATLYVHPDKLQQRGASIQQKYICEKVFDLLKEAWNKFNSEER